MQQTIYVLIAVAEYSMSCVSGVIRREQEKKMYRAGKVERSAYRVTVYNREFNATRNCFRR